MDQDQNTPVNNTFPQGGGEKKNSSTMIVIAAGALIILAGVTWYMMGMKQAGVATPVLDETAQTAPAEDPATAALSVQGTSDEIDAIDADLNATNLDALSEVDTL